MKKRLLSILTLFFAAMSLWAQSPVYVDASMPDDSGDGLTLSTAKKYINSGIALVSVGGTVNVAAGTYVENVVVNKKLSLIGAGSTTTIDPSSGYGLTLSAGSSGSGSSDRTMVQNLRVTGASQGIRFNSSTTHQYITIDNVTSDYNSESGINLREVCTYNDITITNCNLGNNGGGGIQVQETSTVLTGLLIDGCTVSNNTGTGFLVLGGNNTNITVSNSSFSNNGSGTNSNGDLVITGFNGNATLSDLAITSSNAESAIRITGESGAGFGSAGTIQFTDITINGTQAVVGTYPSGAIVLTRYTAVNNVTFSNVILQSTAPNGLFLGTITNTTPPALSLSGITFNGTYDQLIKLGRHGNNTSYAKANVNADATSAVFTGLTDNFVIEDKITHKLDDSELGLVTRVAGNVYVTTNSGSIQRGINAIAAGGTVNVNAGTFAEQILITKALTVNGVDGAVLDGTTLSPGIQWTTGVKIKSGNVTFNNIDVANYTQDGITAYDDIDMPNLHITNCKVSNIQPGNWGFGIYVGYESEGFTYTPPDMTEHFDYSGLLIENNEITNTHSSALVIQSLTGTPGTLKVLNNNIHHNTTNSGIWLDCARNIDIEGNMINANKWGIEFSAIPEASYTIDGPYSPKDISIFDNQIINSTEDGIALYNGWPTTISISHNSITSNSPGLHNYLSVTLNAENNYWGSIGQNSVAAENLGNIDYSPWCEATMTNCSFTSPVTEIWVDDSWSGSSAGDEVATGKYFGYNAFAFIQDANNEIAEDGNIKIYPGLYDQGSYIAVYKEGIDFIGLDANGSPITSAEDVLATVGPLTGGEADMVFHVIANDVSITGLRISDLNNKAMTINGDNFILTKCRFENQWDLSGAIYFYDASPGIKSSANPSVQKTFTISDNVIKGWGVAITDGTGCGWPASGRMITNNTFGISSQYPGYTFYSIGFRSVNGSGWCNSPVGGATITGNVFKDMGSRGYVYFDGQFPAEGLDFNSILANNTFELGAALSFDPSGNPRPQLPSDPLYNPVTRPNLVVLKNNIGNEIAKAQNGDFVKIVPGIYNESINGDSKNDLTILGIDPLNEPVINGNTHFSPCNDLHLENLLLNNTAASPVAYIGGTNLTMDNVTVDGEDIIGHNGISGGQINGDITITNCNFINIKNWVVFDTRSGSGGPASGSLLDQVIFSGNLIDDCQGHVNFRGTIGSPTTSVNISDNTVQNIGNATSSFGGVIKVFYATNCSFTSNTIRDVGTSGYNPAGEAAYGAGFMPRNVSNLTVTDNIFENNNQAIAIEPRNAEIGGYADGVLPNGIIENNFFNNNNYGIYIPSTLHPSSNAGGLLIENHNTFANHASKALHFGYTSGTLKAEENYWGIDTPSGVAAAIDGTVDFDPWCNADFSVCGFTTTSNVYNTDQGTYFETIEEAILAAAIGDEIQVSGEHNDHSIIVNKGLKIAAGAGGAHFNGQGLRSGTLFIVSDPGAIINGFTIEGYDYGVDIIDDGTATVSNCVFINNTTAVRNQNTAAVAMAENNYWGDPSGPLDSSPIGLYNPLGEGNAVSDYVDYQPWYNDAALTQLPVDIALYNPSCGKLEVRIRSAAAVSEVLTNMQFAVAWDADDYTGDVTIVGSPMYGIYLVNHETDIVTGTRYAIFAADYNNLTLTLAANTEQPILTLSLDESGAKFDVADFVIAQDAYALEANADYYLQLYADDRTGYIYGSADNVYVASCDLELDARVFLQGPYDAGTNLMKTDIRTMPAFPTSQPYSSDPFSYEGTESVTSVPADAVDWVLVGLRDDPGGPDDFRVAGLLYKDGKIRGTDGQLISVEDPALFPNTPYYAVVYHRNHMPVMSATAVNIPNSSLLNLTDLTQAYGYIPASATEQPLITLETGVYGMIAGDHYGAVPSGEGWTYFDYPDGWLYYSGNSNDRDPILAKITTYPGNGPYINGVINNEYFKEDLTLNKQVKYSGSGNDPRLIIQNLIELKGSNVLTNFYESKVPGWAVPHDKKEGLLSSTGPLDIGLYDTPRELLINMTANEAFTGAIVSNIQFTLCWDESNAEVGQLIAGYQSEFLLEPQGEPVKFNGKMYQVFATVEPVALPDPLNDGEQVTVMRFAKNDAAPIAAEAISIADNAWTMANNGGYYVAVWGVGKTGRIVTSALGADQPGGMEPVVHIYPNPSSTGWIYLTLTPAVSMNLGVTLADLTGRQVRQSSWNVKSGMANAMTFDLKGLSTGVYLLKINGESFSFTEKIIIR